MSKREKLVVAAGILFLTVAVADRFVVTPWWGYLKKTNKEIVSLQRTVEQQRRLIEYKANVESEVKAYKQFMSAGTSEEVAMASFLREIEKFAQQSEVQLSEIRPLEAETSEFYTEYGLEVQFECNLTAWITFVYLVEDSPSLFVIKKGALTLSESQSDLLKGYLRIRRLSFTQEVPL